MIKLFKKLSYKQLLLIILCAILIVFQVWLDLKLPDYMSDITVLIKTNGTIKDILNPGSKMLLCALGSLASSFIVGFIASFIAASFSAKLRGDVFSKTLDMGMEEMKKFSTSSLITRTTNDITQIQRFVSMGLQVIIKAPILAVWAVLKIANKNWEWSALTGGTVLILLIVIIIVLLLTIPKSKIIQKLTDNLNRITRENITGIRVIHAFNAEKFQEKKFAKANDELTSTNLFINRIMAILSPGMSLLMSSLTLGIYFIGAGLINEAQMLDKITLFSDMVVFSSYAMQVIMAFMMMVMIFIIYPRTLVAAKRILEVLNENIKIKSGLIKKDNDLKGTIEFKNVSFKYPDAEECLLENINFKIKEGETVAFIGGTGSGKSTLINLIPRFYDVTEGEILLDGINIKDYDEEYLRRKIGYIPQKAVIFSGTVRENIAYGDNDKISDDEVIKALKIAQADFVLEKEDALDYTLSSRGTNLSGGQKQRIAIARVIARNPEIFIFDDTFSALDYQTDYRLRKELKKVIDWNRIDKEDYLLAIERSPIKDIINV